MTFIPNTTYDVFVTTGQTINIVVEPSGNAFPPAISGEFNLAVITSQFGSPGAITQPPPTGYQGLAYLSTDDKTLTVSRGDWGVADTGGNDLIWLGLGQQSVLGASGDTLRGNEGSQFLDAHLGNQSVVGGSGNETIWGGANTFINGGAQANETIAGMPGTTVLDGVGNEFIDASAGG